MADMALTKYTHKSFLSASYGVSVVSATKYQEYIAYSLVASHAKGRQKGNITQIIG